MKKRRKTKSKQINKKIKNKFHIAKVIIFSILAIIVILFLIRLITPTEIDDVTPGISCPEMEKYNPDVLYVVPDFENHPISKNQEWCKKILSLNKEVQLHGINHTYREFKYLNITQENLEFGISEFEKCFNKTPEKFKPPQLALSNSNKELIKDNNLQLRNLFDQLTHKVYHCNDSDIISNRWVKII